MNTTCKKCGEAKGLTMGLICGNCGESPEKDTMKPKFTKELPKKEGFYWWTNFGEHTPCVVEVRKDDSDEGNLWAQNEEFCFPVEHATFDKDPSMKVGGHYFGEEMWCYIDLPTIDGKVVKPMSY